MGLAMKSHKPSPDEMEVMEQIEELKQYRLGLTQTYLKKYLPLLKKNQKLIQETPEYFFIRLPQILLRRDLAWYSSLHVPVPLGVLLQLWEDGTLIQPCRECAEGKVHIFFWFGNTLRPQGGRGAGHYLYRGICDSCGDAATGFVEYDGAAMQDFEERIRHAKEISARHVNEETANIIDPGSPQRFSWSKGVIPAVPPIKQVIHPKAIPTDMYDLIFELLDLQLEPAPPQITFS